MVSQNASYFINTMFGWAMVPSADLPGGEFLLTRFRRSVSGFGRGRSTR